MQNQKLNCTLKLNVRPVWEAAKGHQNHRSGAGHHGDRRTKRLKTRAAQIKAAMSD
jgi:hypothetical protein